MKIHCIMGGEINGGGSTRCRGTTNAVIRIGLRLIYGTVHVSTSNAVVFYHFLLPS